MIAASTAVPSLNIANRGGFSDRTVRQTLADLVLTCPGAGAWVWNLLTNTVTWSQEVYRIFDAPDFDNTLESFRKLILQDDMEAGLAVVARALTSRETFSAYFRVRTKKGMQRRLMNTGRAIYDKSGKPKLLVGLVAQVEEVKWPDVELPGPAAGCADSDGIDLEHLNALHEHFLRVRAQKSATAFAESDHKTLIFLLARVMPHQAASGLATELLAKFHSLAAVLAANRARLSEVKGMQEQHIKLLEVTQFAMESALQPRSEPLRFGHPDTLINYLRASHANQTKEQLRVIFLDRADHLIASEIMQEGTVDHSPFYAREIIKRALELSASAIVLVHNHPSGNPAPSLADIELTTRIAKLALGLGIEVRDHIILGKYGTTSLKSAGFFSRLGTKHP